MQNIKNNLTELIGNTPMLRLNNMEAIHKSTATVTAKLEMFNPGGSAKDRIALNMINDAEAKGFLKPGATIIEPTSGNTGVGLAWIAGLKGYKLILTMPETMSRERQLLLKAYGAELVLTEGSKGMSGAIEKAQELNSEISGSVILQQFCNPANPEAHYNTTAEEIWKQTQGRITHFVASLGTSGTLMGVGKALKEKNPNIKIIEAQPELGHTIQGLKNMEEAIVPPIYDPNMMDEHIIIGSEEAFEAARRIVAEENIFIGMSSGAAMVAALKIIPDLSEGCVVVMFPDRGEKYLSTKLFDV